MVNSFFEIYVWFMLTVAGKVNIFVHRKWNKQRFLWNMIDLYFLPEGRLVPAPIFYHANNNTIFT